ncbi:MAG: hypothetical protein AB1758_25525, partial [Candidatus Eremiobacterota bacterium]
MAGHLFILRGDLTQLHCDAWLLPTGRSLKVLDYWMHALPGFRRGPTGRLVDLPEPPPAAWQTRELRAFPLRPWPPGVPAPWLTNVGFRVDPEARTRDRVAWFMEGLRSFLREARTQPTPRVTARSLPLLAVPVVGSGQGGGARVQGDLIRAHLETLTREVAEHDVDVALVTFSEEAFAAAQEARKSLRPRWPLPARLLRLAEGLAGAASASELVLFLGAGVSQAAGLPDWQGLLERLM